MALMINSRVVGDHMWICGCAMAKKKADCTKGLEVRRPSFVSRLADESGSHPSSIDKAFLDLIALTRLLHLQVEPVASVVSVAVAQIGRQESSMPRVLRCLVKQVAILPFGDNHPSGDRHAEAETALRPLRRKRRHRLRSLAKKRRSCHAFGALHQCGR